MMKKLLSLFVLLILLIGGILACPHIHDENCGYNPITNSGCTHEHDTSCYSETSDDDFKTRICVGPDCPHK